MSDRVLPLLVVYVYVLFTYVTPDWFLLVDGFPSNWSLCHFTLEATGLIKNWNFWDSAFQRYWYVLIIFMVAYLS